MAVNNSYNFPGYLLLILCMAGLLLPACDDKIRTLEIDCSECYQEKPDSADIIIHLTIDSRNNKIPLTIYRGTINENIIEYFDTAAASPYYLYVPVGKEYSVKAKYSVNGKTIYAVDGDKLRVKHVSDVCDTDCWVIRGGELNAKLKYSN